MKIIPAIDILDGKCVRLLRGNFDDVTIYSNSPLEQVRKFKDAGFSYIHIVDLDAALSGKNKNLSLIKSIANIESIKIQVGGGIRSIETINNLFEIGVDRLIVGTAAIKNSHFLNQIKEQNISDRIVFGLDFVNIKNEPMLFVNGWTENTRINIFDYLRTNNWIKNILVTDIQTLEKAASGWFESQKRVAARSQKPQESALVVKVVAERKVVVGGPSHERTGRGNDS